MDLRLLCCSGLPCSLPGKDCFAATARVYFDYKDPVEAYASEATASRGVCKEMPSVSPREWAQTAALGIALRNAGFGLQFEMAGESFAENAPDEALCKSLNALEKDPIASPFEFKHPLTS